MQTTTLNQPCLDEADIFLRTQPNLSDDLQEGMSSLLSAHDGTGRRMEHSQPKIRSQAKVLVADDNPLYRRILMKRIHMLGFPHVDLADTGMCALGAVTVKSYDIALLDAEMKGFSGFAISRAIRAWEKKTNRIHSLVILNAAADLLRYSDMAVSSGANHALYKPMTREILNKIFVKHKYL